MSQLSFREYEKFSAYLDGQLSPDETHKLEEQLKARPEWRLALEEISATRTLLRSAPRYRAPRNFTLSPEVARQYARKSWFPRIVSFRFSAAVAALALIAALALQVLPGVGGLTQVAMAPAAESPQNEMFLQSSQDSAAEESQSLKAMEAPTEQASAAAEPTLPPVVQWGPGSTAMGLGGGGGGDGYVDAANGSGIVTYNKESTGSPFQGGGGGGDAPITPEYQSQGGIVTYGGESAPGVANNPPMSLAPQAADQARQAAEAETPAESAPADASAVLEGSGPVLGLPAQDEAGQIIGQSAPSALDSARMASAAGESQAVPGFWSSARILQAGLLGLAVLAGVAAWLARRKG